MSTLTRANVMRGFPSFFLDDLFNLDILPRDSALPNVNVKHENNEYVVKMVLAGIPKENIKLNIEDDCLCINAENKECDCNGCECKVEKTFKLPDNIDIENINAKYENGVLNVVLPKLVKEDKIKIIEIQ